MQGLLLVILGCRNKIPQAGITYTTGVYFLTVLKGGQRDQDDQLARFRSKLFSWFSDGDLLRLFPRGGERTQRPQSHRIGVSSL